MIDLDAVRADTPGCRNVLHFNNAGASLMPTPVFEAVQSHLESERDLGGYEAARLAKDQQQSFYTEFASLLNVQPSEIAYVENATRAWDMAFYALPLKEGDRIITHASEYASNYLAFLHLAGRRGVEIDIAPSDKTGQIDVKAMDRMIRKGTRAIAITHVPTQGGLVNPAEAVGEVAGRHGLIYLLDACQSAGQMQVDARKIGCHVLSGTGRKFLRGPRGTGFLFVDSGLADTLDPPFVDLHAATWTGKDTFELAPGARRFENFESNVAGRIGLARAVRYARGLGMDAIESRVTELAASLRGALGSVSGVTLHDLGERKCGIVTFSMDGRPSPDVAAWLAERSINVSVSAVEHAQLDLGARQTGPLVRASVHYFNTENEIERFVAAIAEM
ncbi:MAG: aminotransferase class V-fold PLP-dependent enzyme [Anderseniella sp.]|jgi:selenocysteine lyase/cysteine desulfurase|nr:aminotransferase class V-fold PLP-dependent enzyme [Anderseniella sp.]